MPRPRNEEIRAKIQKAFWRSFQENGYEATSYSLVAQRTDLTKALVQYHFPKKELLAIALMDRLLAETENVLHIEPSGGTSQDFANLFRIGQSFFAFLLQRQGYRRFLYDVIKSRDLTEDVLAFDLNWALGFVKQDRSDEQEVLGNTEIGRSVIVHMGGFYELLYHCLKNDQPFDVSAGLNDVLVAFIGALGFDRNQALELLAPGLMSEEELKSTVESLNDRLLF